MRATDGITRILLPGSIVRGWPIRQLLAASIVVATALASFLVARRFSGAINVALPVTQLAVVAVLLLTWAVAVRALVPGRLAPWLVAGVLLMFALACSFPGERAVDWFVWLATFGAFIASHDVATTLPARRAAARKPRSRTIETADTERVLQQLTRSRTAGGQDVICGTLLAEFVPGERSATLYVAFCPPFERPPNVELESAADARLIQTLHNGTQIEVRLPAAAKTAMSATVEFYATDAE